MKERYQFVLVGCAALALFVAVKVHEHQRDEENAAYSAAMAVEQAAASAYFGTLSPAQALQHCRERWEAQGPWSLYYPPVALAWSRAGIDAYYLQGADVGSMRHFQCNADGSVVRGNRYARPDRAQAQAEATEAQAEADEIPADAADVDRDPIAAALVRLANDQQVIGVELYRTLDQQLLQRTWQGAERAQANSVPADRDFPQLAQLPFAPESNRPKLAALPLITSLQQPFRAFAALRTTLPRGAKILRLKIGHDRLDVTIEGPIADNESETPAPAGDMSYDEYAIADRTWWYPRSLDAQDCQRGQPLDAIEAELKQRFDPARRYLSLQFNCGWTLHEPQVQQVPEVPEVQ